MPSPGSEDQTTVAEVVFAAEDARVVIALAASLADEDGLADELTDIAAYAESRAELADEVQQVADHARRPGAGRPGGRRGGADAPRGVTARA